MSERIKKLLMMLGSAFLTLAGLFPDAGLSLLTRLLTGMQTHPVRGLSVCVGLALAAYVFRDPLLDLFGVQTTTRLAEKIKKWLLDTYQHPLIEATCDGKRIKIVTKHDERQFTISKEPNRSMLFVQATTRVPNADQALYRAASADDRIGFGEDVVIELSRLDLDTVNVTEQNGLFVDDTTYHIILDKDFNEYRLLRGIFQINRAQVLVDALWHKWRREQIKKQHGG
jgi:hypothetical protein